MSDILISVAAGGGTGSDECTSVLAHVLAGETAVTSDSGDEAKPGTMTVNSLLSFSAAAYSGRRVLAKWGNPKAAPGRPYSGVYICYSTGGYPGKTGGTQVYKGAGSNTASGGQSQVYLDMPALNTTYYMSCIPYVTTNMGELLGEPLNTAVATPGQLLVTITGTQNYTIPVGFSLIDIFCVGGGAGAGTGEFLVPSAYGGNGGGGGYTITVLNAPVAAGQVLSCMVGAGGAAYTDGAASQVSRGGAVLCAANGGHHPTGHNSYGNGNGGDGGSGGGGGGFSGRNGGNGGSDGNNGQGSTYDRGGSGQGRTTRAFGETGGTLYSGGGAGGRGYPSSNPGSGGPGGGGGQHGNGTPNTGGGGGGGGDESNISSGGSGGSGIILMRLH